jgi:hypothetical protein
MKKDNSFLKFVVVIISMTALNVFLENSFPEKTFTSVTIGVCGFITLLIFSVYSQAIETQYENAQLILHRRYKLIKLISRRDSEDNFGVEGAVLSFFDENQEKHFLFFKNVKFSSDIDVNKVDEKFLHESFICVCEKGELALKPKSLVEHEHEIAEAV